MRLAAPSLLLLLAALVAAQTPRNTTSDDSHSVISDTQDNHTLSDKIDVGNDTFSEQTDDGNDTLSDLSDASNDTLIETDGDHDPVVRKKRTFGDIVFRGLADVLGYNVQRKPPPVAFPPPLAPVPGIDAPLQAVAAPAVAAPAPAPAAAPAAPPCGAPRAAGPPPCRAPRPPPPPPPPKARAPPPCPKPRAAPRPKPRPPPPPPPPPPCARPRANPATPAPCAPAPPTPPPPPPPKADSNLETISSNFRLNFNFNRSPVTPAPAAADAEEEAEQEVEQEQAAPLEPLVPIAIRPQAAQLPQTEPRKPRVFVDAFLVRNGIAQRVDTIDANHFNPQQAADEDYNTYDDVSEQQLDDDYEDVQESRDRAKAVAEFGSAVDRFWEKKKQQRKPKTQRLPENHYQNVHFGDREVRLQSLQRERPQPNRIPVPEPDPEDDAELTTTTEDPKKPLRPRVLPPTEHNPNQIDTVTVRVPPIYKEKRPKKLHRGPSESAERDSEESYNYNSDYNIHNDDSDTNGEDSWLAPLTEPPTKRKRKRRKKNRNTRSVDDYDPYEAGDFDYYGKKIPVSDEEKLYMELTIPPPTKDADLARHEARTPEEEQFLDDHERLREDPERIKVRKKNRDSEKADSSERSGESERSTEDKGRADEHERSDKLSPNAQVQETQYQNQFVHAHNVQVDDPRPVAQRKS